MWDGLTFFLVIAIDIEDVRHSHQVQRHSKLGIDLNVQGLGARKAGTKFRARIELEAAIWDVEQLGRVGGRRQRIGIAYSGDVVLVNHALAAAASGLRRGHFGA